MRVLIDTNVLLDDLLGREQEAVTRTNYNLPYIWLSISQHLFIIFYNNLPAFLLHE